MLHSILNFQKPYKFPLIHLSNLAYRFNQNYSLVNVKLKWVKDNVLDTVVTGEKELKAASLIVSLIASDPGGCLPIYRLSGRRRGQLGLSGDVKVSTFMRRYPNIFNEFHVPDSSGTLVPWFTLTPDAIKLNQEKITVFRLNQEDYVNRLCKLLMLTKDLLLPLQTIEQLKWDLGLPHDYVSSLIPNYKNIFSLVRLEDDRIGLKLNSWQDKLAVSQLESNYSSQSSEFLAFPIGFTRGFGLKKKSIKWLNEWQKLPYTSPYSDSTHLDSRTDVSEKRIVGVFHELLHLTVKKKTERKNVSNLRKPLNLPQKFTKVFERHPGIFYISKKNDTQTVVLREAYDRYKLVHKHPICEIRDRFACLMKEGFLDRSRGLYKKDNAADSGEDELDYTSDESCENGFESDGHNMFSEYESDCELG